MKAKVLIFSIILSLNFANNCEAQILGDIVNTAMRKKAEKKKQKKQKEQKEQTNTDEIHMLLERSEFNEDMDVLMPDMSEDNGKQVTIKKEDNKPNVNVKSNDDVALTVSADGATKEEATKIALRSAIEQAYGTFVSANTTILNDDMVKDEIVTISNGNIKSYQEIASAILPNGRTTVTLNAVVSISKLTSFAKSKGASTEFAGATFAMNVKMRELNKKNEMKALDNLIVQIKNLLPVALERELVLSEPELYSRHSPLDHYFNYKNKQMNPDNYFILKLGIKYKSNENTIALGNLIYSTLKALEPSEEEYKYFKTDAHAQYAIATLTKNKWDMQKIKTRLSEKEFENYDSKINKVLTDYMTDFEIIDNTGVKSSFNASLWGKYFAICDGSYLDRPEYKKMIAIAETENMDYMEYHGTGIFNPIVVRTGGDSMPNFFNYLYRHEGELYGYKQSEGIQWDFAVIIPKANIAKYTQFTIQPKTK